MLILGPGLPFPASSSRPLPEGSFPQILDSWAFQELVPPGYLLKAKTSRWPKGILHEVLSPAQHAEYDNLPPEEKKIFLLRKWTEKEARFKCSDAEIFMPRQTVDDCAALLQDLITLDGEYVYSLAYKSTLLFDSEPIRLFDFGCEIVKYRFK